MPKSQSRSRSPRRTNQASGTHRSRSRSQSSASRKQNTSNTEKMPSLAEGVDFDKIAREWRLKYDPKDEKKAAAEVNKLLVSGGYLGQLKSLSGFVSVQRVVCGGCFDFKIITQLEAGDDKWAAWEKAEFTIEKEFLEKVKAIEGVSAVETQTYTLMTL